MSLKKIVKYELDMSVDIISPEFQKKMGVKTISKGLKIELGDLLIILFDYANKNNIIKKMSNNTELIKDKDLFLMEVYKEHLNVALPLMYYFKSLDAETKNVIIEKYVHDLMDMFYEENNESAIFEKIVGKSKRDLAENVNISKKLIDSEDLLNYLNNDIEVNVESGYLLVFKLLEPNLPVFNKLSFPNMDVFSNDSIVGKIKTLSNIQKFTPLIYDLFTSDTENIIELSNFYDMNVEGAFNECLKNLNILNIETLNFKDCETILNAYVKSKNPEKKELMLSFFENLILEPHLPSYTRFKLTEILNMFTENKIGLEVINEIPKNILTRNLIVEQNDNVFYFDVDSLIKTIKTKMNDRGFLKANHESNIFYEEIEILGRSSIKNNIHLNMELKQENSFLIDQFSHLESIMKNKKFQILIDTLKDNNINVAVEEFENENKQNWYGFVKVTVENSEYKKIVIDSFKSFLKSDKEQLKEIIDSLSDVHIMNQDIKVKNKFLKKLQKF